MVDHHNIADGKPLRVAVVDAQPLFRDGLARALRTCKITDNIVEGRSAKDALRIAEAGAIDILLLDPFALGGTAGIIDIIRRQWPAVHLVVLTASERAEDVIRALRSGARGYILKDVDGPELCKALQMVANNKVYLSPSLGARLVALTAAPVQRPSPPCVQAAALTAREHQILSQVSTGATNKEIARALLLSEKTVKYYMTNVMEKMQVRNRVEAVVAARRHLNLLA